ncbi:unnamed protein product [Cuscuta europaea]|uniref:Uncharacterized protein n=1 Tax=Cuscuta europaea TaxID=41803 RepID=A0A9P1ED67_CUSEU|nr:unnamed protein product [Cuscuta europaea]
MNSDEKEVDSPHRRLSSCKHNDAKEDMVTREEFKDLRKSVEELTKVVNSLNQAIVKNSTTNGYTSQQPLCGAPLMVTSFSNPKNYHLGSPTNTNFMKIFNFPLEEKLTSPPTNERKKIAQQKIGSQFGRKLFKHKTEGNSSACYLN